MTSARLPFSFVACGTGRVLGTEWGSCKLNDLARYALSGEFFALYGPTNRANGADSIIDKKSWRARARA